MTNYKLKVIIDGIKGYSNKPLLILDSEDINEYRVLAKFINKENAELFVNQLINETSK